MSGSSPLIFGFLGVQWGECTPSRSLRTFSYNWPRASGDYDVRHPLRVRGTNMFCPTVNEKKACTGVFGGLLMPSFVTVRRCVPVV